MDYFSIEFNATPARRHNKTGGVERKHAVARALCLCLKQDARCTISHPSGSSSAAPFHTIIVAEVLSRATYLSNILYGSRTLSSFEMAKGYTPSIVGIPKSPLCNSLITDHQEQQAKRKLRKNKNMRDQKVLKKLDFSPNQVVYYFKKFSKFGSWHFTFAPQETDHVVYFSASFEHQGHPTSATYEDVDVVPKTPLL